MSNIDAVNALITAINFDRFAEIEARHSPDVTFASFRSSVIHGSVEVEDWQKAFLRDYADCNYTELEYIEDGETVATRATIEAKGYDWRPFTQRVIELMTFEEGEVKKRHLYAMLPDLELDKAATAAMTAATEATGSSASQTRKLAEDFANAILAGDKDAARALLDPKAVLIDTVNGVVQGPDAIVDLKASLPKPAIGKEHVVHAVAGPKDACVEIAIEDARPRLAEWIRVVDGKIRVIESYWMLREIGVEPPARKRHQRQAIYPI